MKVLNLIVCKVVGHAWRFKNYDLHLKFNTGKEGFTKSRRCKRCGSKEVFTNDEVWVKQEVFLNTFNKKNK